MELSLKISATEKVDTDTLAWALMKRSFYGERWEHKTACLIAVRQQYPEFVADVARMKQIEKQIDAMIRYDGGCQTTRTFSKKRAFRLCTEERELEKKWGMKLLGCLAMEMLSQVESHRSYFGGPLVQLYRASGEHDNSGKCPCGRKR